MIQGSFGQHLMSRRTAFRLFALLFFAAAAYHLLAVMAPTIGILGPRWRHALFVAIDIAFAGLLLQRPLWLVVPFTILTIQALYSHGTHAWTWWHLEHRVDWLSLGVIDALPIMLIVVIQDWRERKS